MIGAFLLLLASSVAAVQPVADPFGSAAWISTGLGGETWGTPVRPAPVFRTAFELPRTVRHPRLAICGLGYFDCTIDGRPITDGLLMPGQTQYDLRWRYRVFDLPPLVAGRHVISIEVGDGFYHATTREVWHFDKASWRSGPKAICRLVDADSGAELVKTDDRWRVRSCVPTKVNGKTEFRPTAPRVFNSVRGGEVYDARLEFPADEVDGPDWLPAYVAAPPGGMAEEEKFPPCRVTAVQAMARMGDSSLWRAPSNLAGNVRLTVRGQRGAKVMLTCGERLKDGKLFMAPLECFCDQGETNKTFQRDTYILKGEGTEVWTPKFTYHGFQYAEAAIEGAAEIVKLEALEIHNDVRRLGSFRCSDPILERVAQACERSILSNLQNVQTDCPQREKNGWIGDINLRCESALYAFDVAPFLKNEVTLAVDTQRPSGQFNGIVPCAGWGYQYSGGYSDTGIFEIPAALARFTGDNSARQLVAARMPAYVAYMQRMRDGRGVPQLGLWDWLHPRSCPRLDWQFVRLVAYAKTLSLDARFAREYAEAKANLARHFFVDGLPPYTNSAAFAMALDAGVIADARRPAALARMVEILQSRQHRVDCGMNGIIRVLRVLGDNGCADDLYAVMTQPEKPGYAYWTETLKLTTLPERWDIDEQPERDGSLCHAAFSEYLACIYRYFAGFRYAAARPGPNHLEVRPLFPRKLDWLDAEHHGYRVNWRRKDNGISFELTVPKGKTATLALPGHGSREVGPGTYREFLAADAAVRIDCGRQLFVDDVLIARARGVTRHWNHPIKVEDPILWPERGSVNLTGATDGGLWWDPQIRRFRLWYQQDWCGDACYAESTDGIKWEFPDLGIVPGTNRLFEREPLDSWCVVPDYTAADPYSRWCMSIAAQTGNDTIYESGDGRHFSRIRIAGKTGDRSTLYFDPFRRKWIFSLRDCKPGVVRMRRYYATDTFDDTCGWTDKNEEWLVATNRPNWQLYNFDAVAYESLMLGVMEVLYNTPRDNDDCMQVGLPKQTGLHFCFSRDGRTFVPRDEADIAPSGWGSGKWDTGYLSPIGGICVIRDEKLWFYYTALRGDGCRLEQKEWTRNGMYSNGAIGAAVLRRDGFAGMVADAEGELVTCPLVFSGEHLFINAECRFGSVAAEVLDANGQVVPGFARTNCVAFARADSTKTELRWQGAALADLKDKAVRFRFWIRCATLYSFWVSPSVRGESGGYVAGGGPAYSGLRDR